MAEQLLVKFDPSVFKWTELPSKDGFVRMLGGGEVVQDAWNRYHKGDQNLFFGVYVDIETPLSETKLKEAARDAWLWLRFHVPTIGAAVDPAEDGTSRLIYKLGSNTSVAEWASRTFIVSQRAEIDIDAFRVEAGKKKIPSPAGDQSWGYLLLGPAQGDGSVKKFGFLFHTHHSPFDGDGLKVIVNQYLVQLAKSLSPTGTLQTPLRWGTEGTNLVPAVFNILQPSVPQPILPGSSEEPSFAHPYYGSMGAVLQTLGEGANNPYGFKPRKADPGWPSHAREEITFSAEESARILASLKPTGSSDTSKAYTVSHLAHAALAMTVIADNPPSAEAGSQFLNNQHLRDCRSLLLEPYSSREGYPGYALGVGGIRIPVSLFLTGDGNPAALDKTTLVKVMKAVRDLYAGQKALPDPISFMGFASRIFAQMMIAGFKANMSPPNNCYSFSSDGISEKWLNNDFKDASGKTILKVPKFVMSLNRTDPAPFFRITSWNGILELSADFNSNLTSVAEAKVYMANWKKFMLLATSLNGGDY